MSRLSTTRKSSLLAIALGLTAIGSTTIPAAAHPGVGSTLSGVSPLASMPHPTGGFVGGAASGLKQALPASSTISHTAIGNLSNAPAHVIGLKPSAPAPIAKATIGDLQSPAHVVGQAGGQTGTAPKGPMGIVVNPKNGKNGVDNICPFNKFKCAPQGQPGPSTAGTNPPAPQNPGPPPGSNPSMPGGPGYPSGGISGGGISGSISGVLSGVMSGGSGPVYLGQTAPVAVPTPVVQPPRVVTGATAPAPVASEPCNCLTKQYLDDGSVLFRDLCTKEAAIATPAELRSQAQSAAPAVQ